MIFDLASFAIGILTGSISGVALAALYKVETLSKIHDEVNQGLSEVEQVLRKLRESSTVIPGETDAADLQEIESVRTYLAQLQKKIRQMYRRRSL